MTKVFAIARYTYTEIFRNKVFYTLLLFAGLMMAATLLFAALGGEQRLRMMVDLGLAAIEIFSLLSAVFASVTLVLEEMESRTIYLLLTRPVPRWAYLLGRFVGLITIMTATLLIMAVFHLALLFWRGWHATPLYFVSLLYSWEKVVMVAALALFFSLFSTSAISSLTFTFFFWVLGHFSQELRFLSQRVQSVLGHGLATLFYYVCPNFQHLNVRDRLDVPAVSAATLGWALLYGMSYTFACLLLSVLLFRKKEF